MGSHIISSIVFLAAVNNLTTVSCFTLPLSQIQHTHVHNRIITAHWRHSGHDRYPLPLQTLYESNSKDVVDEIWGESDKPIDLDSEGLAYLGDEEGDSVVESSKAILAVGAIAVIAVAGALAVAMRNDLGLDLQFAQLINDPSNSFDTILEALGTMDSQKGMIYFASFYVLAEILAIPAVS